MKNIVIYCEGTAGSHDYDILSKIIDSVEHQPRIVPLGGKKGAGGFINIHRKQAQTIDFYLFFRDYDFDFEDKRLVNEVQIASLLVVNKKENDGKIAGKWCVSYRTTIENYLFNPAHFFAFLEQRNECDKYNLHSEDAVKQFFDEVAKDLAPYQAVRHTLGKMRISTDFGTTFTKGSGQLPSRFDASFCKDKAIDKINTEKNKAVKNWTEEQFGIIFNEFHRVFITPEFYINMDYLIWYQGKDFAKRITQKLSQFQIERYYNFAKKHFDYTQFPDLVELKTLIETVANA